MENKTCTKCKKTKSLVEFNKNKRIKDGYHYNCKYCCKLLQKEHYELNKDSIKEKYENNKKTISQNRKNNYNSLKSKTINKKYYEKNKENILAQKKLYSENNKDTIKSYQVSYQKEYRNRKNKSDSFFKFKNSTRDLIKSSIRNKNFTKKSKTAEILGCSYEEFKTYIESKWQSWMNWDNYGNWDGIAKEINYSWDIDHIIPLSSAIDEEQFIRLNHYTNLQPLCSYINRFIKRNQIL